MQVLDRHFQAMADSINFHHVDHFIRSFVDIPIVCAVLYVAMVLYVPKNYMKDRAPCRLRALNLIWNLFLAAFSFIGAYFTVPRLYELITASTISGIDPSALRYVGNMTNAMKRNIIIPPNFREGVDTVAIRGSLDTSICVWNENMYRRGVTGMMSIAFMFSKIPEMIDTVFLVLQKKNIMFLHWYHHTSVMLFCWHAWTTPTSNGLWFVVMNYCVHSVMYFYYFMCACGQRKLVRPFAPLITILQISQMVIGTAIALYTFVMHQFGSGCDCGSGNAKLAVLMYLSYFFLFSKFFKDSYLSKSKKRAA